MLNIVLDTGNDAFYPVLDREIKRILSSINYNRLINNGRVKLMDKNGNSVGYAEYTED